MTEHGRFVWTELNTRDAETAKRFYEATVGWTFEPISRADGSTYWIAKMGSEIAAGVFTMSGLAFLGVPEHWFSYLEVDDVDQRTAGVKAAGGTVMREPWTIPNVGRVAIVRAPGGGVMGWMTSAPKPG